MHCLSAILTVLSLMLEHLDMKQLEQCQEGDKQSCTVWRAWYLIRQANSRGAPRLGFSIPGPLTLPNQFRTGDLRVKRGGG